MVGEKPPGDEEKQEGKIIRDEDAFGQYGTVLLQKLYNMKKRMSLSRKGDNQVSIQAERAVFLPPSCGRNYLCLLSCL